jgi:hypothetical protein
MGEVLMDMVKVEACAAQGWETAIREAVELGVARRVALAVADWAAGMRVGAMEAADWESAGTERAMAARTAEAEAYSATQGAQLVEISEMGTGEAVELGVARRVALTVAEVMGVADWAADMRVVAMEAADWASAGTERAMAVRMAAVAVELLGLGMKEKAITETAEVMATVVETAVAHGVANVAEVAGVHTACWEGFVAVQAVALADWSAGVVARGISLLLLEFAMHHRRRLDCLSYCIRLRPPTRWSIIGHTS